MSIKTILGLTVVGAICLSCQSNVYQIEGFARDLNDGDTICLIQNPNDGMATITLVENGKFAFAGETSDISVCQIFAKKAPDETVTFFLEPSRITVELASQPEGNRVSGTYINNQWQQLSDSIALLGREAVKTVLRQARDSAEQRQQAKSIDSIHRRMSDCIQNTAKRNSDNALGQYIHQNYEAPKFD